jgi:hypothetical protein
MLDFECHGSIELCNLLAAPAWRQTIGPLGTIGQPRCRFWKPRGGFGRPILRYSLVELDAARASFDMLHKTHRHGDVRCGGVSQTSVVLKMDQKRETQESVDGDVDMRCRENETAGCLWKRGEACCPQVGGRPRGLDGSSSCRRGVVQSMWQQSRKSHLTHIRV